MSKNVYVVDIEANALYDDVSEVHVVSYTPLSHLEVKSLTTEKDINGIYDKEMDLGGLAKGTYILKIESDNESAVRRVMKH